MIQAGLILGQRRLEPNAPTETNTAPQLNYLCMPLASGPIMMPANNEALLRA
jgi:hypothetical protein